MENYVAEPNVQLLNINDNMQIKKVTKQREVKNILSQNKNTDKSKKETCNISVKSVKEIKLPLDMEEYEKMLMSSREFCFNIELKIINKVINAQLKKNILFI